jgi:hypothetical protein
MRILAAIGTTAIAIAIAAAFFFFGGYFNVAASAPDPGFVNWVLAKVRMASIDHRARVTSPLNLDETEVVRAGARASSKARVGIARFALPHLSTRWGALHGTQERGTPKRIEFSWMALISAAVSGFPTPFNFIQTNL